MGLFLLHASGKEFGHTFGVLYFETSTEIMRAITQYLGIERRAEKGAFVKRPSQKKGAFRK